LLTFTSLRLQSNGLSASTIGPNRNDQSSPISEATDFGNSVA
jgi:hypothetical protein